MPDQPQPGVYPAGVTKVPAGVVKDHVVVSAHDGNRVIGRLVVHHDQPDRRAAGCDRRSLISVGMSDPLLYVTTMTATSACTSPLANLVAPSSFIGPPKSHNHLIGSEVILARRLRAMVCDYYRRGIDGEVLT